MVVVHSLLLGGELLPCTVAGRAPSANSDTSPWCCGKTFIEGTGCLVIEAVMRLLPGVIVPARRWGGFAGIVPPPADWVWERVVSLA
mgnify:CR=1 FL=1